MTVAPDELTGTEQAVLLVLMAECRPVPNPELKMLGPELKKTYRDRLRDKKLINVTPGTPMVIELSDDGWRLCRMLFGTEPPLGVRGQNKALYTLMKAFDRYLERADLALADVFAAGEDAGVEDRIRAAYDRLAPRAGGWVGLAALRRELAGVDRDTLDTALVRLDRTPGVSLVPEENQKTLTAQDRAAAVRIGNEDNHLIAIEA